MIQDAPLIEREEKETRERKKTVRSGIGTWDLTICSPMRYRLSYHHDLVFPRIISKLFMLPRVFDSLKC